MNIPISKFFISPFQDILLVARIEKRFRGVLREKVSLRFVHTVVAPQSFVSVARKSIFLLINAERAVTLNSSSGAKLVPSFELLRL